MSNHQFYSREVIAMLEQAGWFEGRNVAASLVLPGDSKYQASILEILQEFGELFVNSTGPGVSMARNSIDFNPMEAEGENEVDGRLYYYGQLLDRPLYPLGYVPDDSLILCIDATGRTYMVGDNLYLVGMTFVSGVSNILLGIRGKIFHETELRWMD
jgi:SUKH-3 immunity protein